MVRYVLVRMGQLVVTLFIASVAVFFIIENAPGNPAQFQVGINATPAQVAVEAHKLGLYGSLPHRYLIWLTQALHLNLGVSFSNGLPVTSTIVTAFGYTFRLAVFAILLGLLFGIPLGMIAALRRGHKLDSLISAGAATGLSVPVFASGTLFILVFSVHLKVLPSAGGGLPGQTFVSAVRYTLMPALTLAIPFAAVLIRYIRMELGEVMGQPYILTARSLGLSAHSVVWCGWRNALIPTITVMGIQAARLLAGAMITETVFSYPGIGYLTLQSIQDSDYPVVEGVLLLAAVVFLLVMFAVDILVGVVDPRVRVGRR